MALISKFAAVLLFVTLLHSTELEASDQIQPSPPLDRFAIGFELAYGYVTHFSRALVPVPGEPDSAPKLGEGLTGSLSGQINFDLMLGPRWKHFGALSVALGYVDAGTKFVRNVVDYPERVLLGNEEVTSPLTQYTAELSYSLLTTEILFHYYASDKHLRVYFGPQLAFPMSDLMREHFKLVQPREASFAPDPDPKDDLRYSRDNRSIHLPERSLPDARKTLYALKLGMLYEFRIKRFIAAPFYSIGLVLKQPSSTVSWKLTWMHFGLRLMHTF